MTHWVKAFGDAPEYGLGLMHVRIAGQDAWGHSGDIDGFHGDLWYLPAADVTVVALVNRTVSPLAAPIVHQDRRRLVDALARVAVGED